MGIAEGIIRKFEDFIKSGDTRTRLLGYLGLDRIPFSKLKNTSQQQHTPLSSEEIKYIKNKFNIMEKYGYHNEYEINFSKLQKWKWAIDKYTDNIFRKF